MIEKIRHPNTYSPHALRGAAVLLGTATVAFAALRMGGPEHLNFDPSIAVGQAHERRVTPQTCETAPSAVIAPITDTPQTMYLGVLGSESHYADAIRIKGTRDVLTVTPLEGPERTIFTNAIPAEQVMQLPMEDDTMLVQIGRGPGVGAETRMVVAVGCNQAAIDRQQAFYEDQQVIFVPPMKVGQ